MDTAIEKELNFITAAIKTHTDPESIYLFGSHSKGKAGSDSDIDIYVIVPDSESDIVELNAKICFDLAQKKYFPQQIPVDILIGKKSVFENRKKRLTLEKTIADDGVKIYG
jgi:predicted nucleotidyltransferase